MSDTPQTISAPSARDPAERAYGILVSSLISAIVMMTAAMLCFAPA